jgi:7-cyano-7-deazaguanine synthase
MKKIGLILLSGGLDSTTVAAYALKEEYELMALTFHYGQKHSREIESARKIARILGLKHEVADISFYKKLAWYSALTSSSSYKVPQRRKESEMAKDIPITYVPLRNTFFLTLAAAYLESQALNLIEKEKVDPGEIRAAIFIAANAIDYSGYPDCRPEFYDQISRVLLLGSKLGTQYHNAIHIETPIITKTKAEIIRLALELEAPLEHTWSCYEGGDRPCGRCDSCLLRAKGFQEAGCPDPALAGPKRKPIK